jgi:hypothetical protein
MNQYWMKVKYSGTVGGNNPCWELTRGRFRSEIAVRNAYVARAKSLDYEILEVKPHEQFKLALEN